MVEIVVHLLLINVVPNLYVTRNGNDFDLQYVGA